MSAFGVTAFVSLAIVAAWLVLALRIRASLHARYGGVRAEGDHGRAENGRRLRKWWADPAAAGERRALIALTALLIASEIALTVALLRTL